MGKLKHWKLCFCFRWQHFCVLYDSSRQKIDIFGNGVLTFSKDTISVLSGLAFHEDLLSLITIGKRFVSSFPEYCLSWSHVQERPRRNFRKNSMENLARCTSGTEFWLARRLIRVISVDRRVSVAARLTFTWPPLSQILEEEEEDDSLIFNWNNVTLETGDRAEMIYKETDCPSSLNADTTTMVGFGTKV